MQDLINAINNSHSKDIIDIIAIFSPIVLSVVAIVISIYTVHKQNKIALFEIRYKAFSLIKMIVVFDAEVHDCKDGKIILHLFDSCFGTHASLDKSGFAFMDANAKIESIKNDVMTSIFVLDKKHHHRIQEILSSFHLFLASVVTGELDEKLQLEFHESCTAFYKQDMPVISKKLKL